MIPANIKQRPWWLFVVLPWGAWVTLSPNIYYPKGTDPARFPNVIAHERVHLQEQAGGLCAWLLHYLTSRAYRLDMEARAYAAEAGVCRALGDAPLAESTITSAAQALASWEYGWAATTIAQAEALIRSYLEA